MRVEGAEKRNKLTQQTCPAPPRPAPRRSQPGVHLAVELEVELGPGDVLLRRVHVHVDGQHLDPVRRRLLLAVQEVDVLDGLHLSEEPLLRLPARRAQHADVGEHGLHHLRHVACACGSTNEQWPT